MRHDTHAFSWEQEQADDRPSEFRTSTSYTLLHGEDDTRHQPRRVPRRHHKSSSSGAWRLLTLVLLAGSAVIFVFATHVRG